MHAHRCKHGLMPCPVHETESLFYTDILTCAKSKTVRTTLLWEPDLPPYEIQNAVGEGGSDPHPKKVSGFIWMPPPPNLSKQCEQARICLCVSTLISHLKQIVFMHDRPLQ